MSIFKKLSSLFSPGEKGDEAAYWLYVQCNHCGEAIRARVDLQNDLSTNYADRMEDTTYFCRKVLMGDQRCFQKIEVEITFDHRRRLMDRLIEGGQFITEEEYNRLEG